MTKKLSPLNLAAEKDEQAFAAASDRYQGATVALIGSQAASASASRARAQAINDMRQSGATWEQIQQATGLSRQRLWQLVK